MLVKQMSVGPMANFVYLVMDEKSREALAVDSGWEIDPMVDAAAQTGATLKFAVATHGHFDHTSTLQELGENTGAKVVAHEDSPLECDVRVSDGSELKLGNNKVKVIHTPGHTEDSICLYDGRNVFTGDTLFIGTIGRFEKSASESMYRSLYEVLPRLPSSTVVYPGHDYGDVSFRTLGEEAKANAFLMAKDFRGFQSLFS